MPPCLPVPAESATAPALVQCLTLRGYALVTTGDDGKPTYYGKPCPAGTYNPGGNDALWPSCFRCMMGMTTNSTGATSWGDCVAPAGWYYDADANAARMCPKGTFTAAPSRVGACTPCNEGVTTLGFGSDSPLACDRAQPGWSYQGGGASAPCPDDTYNDADNEAATCTPCPNGAHAALATCSNVVAAPTLTGCACACVPAGKRTQFDPRFVKPVSVDACDVPPGNELTDGVVTPCAVNSSKADWGDRACEPCGAGLFTASAGAEYCLVPAGSGLVSFRPPLAAEPCPRDTYGSNEARPVGGMYGLNARCSMCPPHLFTDESPPDGSGYMSVTACKVMPGWGMSGSLGAQWPALCAQGTYNEGRNREPCKPCPDGNTTEDVGATSAADCVAATAP